MNVAIGFPCPQCGGEEAFLGAPMFDDVFDLVISVWMTCQYCEHTWLEPVWNPN